jgi:S-adenosylmethionine:tRNA ribosyltransferase-isomerase
MDIKEFDYPLDRSLIAQEPIEPRDHSRLLILNRKTQEISHHYFYEITNYLSDNDVLVLNNSQVLPARLLGKKEKNNKPAEILLIRPKNQPFFNAQIWPARWLAIGGPKLKKGDIINFNNELSLVIKEKLNYQLVVEFNQKDQKLKEIIYQLGEMPLPPYIKNPTEKSFLNYQTVYAQELGSIAAPTAGFHFTSQLIEEIKKKGVEIEFITLHVGLGTFLPIKSQKVEHHQMEREYFRISPETASRLNQAKDKGKRIIAVGTTVTRVLETISHEGKITGQENWTELFIYPGYQFKFIDALITNFHLPQSTPLLLVSAFAGKNLIFKAYQEAQEKKYRFYSFGDAMFII